MSFNDVPDPTQAELQRLLKHTAMWPSISTAVTQGLHLDTEHSLQRTHSIIFSFVLDSQTSECLTSKYSLTKASIASIDAAAELAGSISMMHAPRDHIAGPISQARARLRAAAERGQALYAATVSSQPNALPTSMITLSYPSNRLFLPDVEVLPGSWAEAMLQGYQFVKRSLSKYRVNALMTGRAQGGGACQTCKKMSPSVKLMACSRCLQIKYCSKECQKANYKVHRESCVLIAAYDAPRSPRDLIHRFVDHLGPELQAAVFSAFGLFTLEPIYGHVLLNTLRQRPTGPTRDPSLAFEVLDATTLTNEQMLLRLSPERQDTLRRIFAKQQPSSAMETESVTCAVAVLQIVGVEGFLPCPLVMCEVQDQLCAKVGWARRARFCALEKDGDWAGALKRRVALSDLDRTVEVKGAPSKLTPREHARWLEGCIV